MIRSICATILVVALMFVVAAPVHAQQQSTPPLKTYVVGADQLTPGQIAQLEAGEKLETIEAVSQYAGVGKEIGEGVSGALGALNDEAEKFGNTKVGHFTMAMIAWKIMGDDIVEVSQDMIGYIVGIPLLFLSSLVLLWSYRRQCLPRQITVKREKGPFGACEYEVQDAPVGGDRERLGIWALAHAIMFLVIIAISSLMIFG